MRCWANFSLLDACIADLWFKKTKCMVKFGEIFTGNHGFIGGFDRYVNIYFLFNSLHGFVGFLSI